MALQLARQPNPPPVSNALFRVGRQPSQRDSNTMLAATIRNSLRPDAISSEQPPRTVGEFAERFQEVENMIGVFMNRYDSGQLSKLGWDSSESLPHWSRTMLMFPRSHQNCIIIAPRHMLSINYAYCTVFLYVHRRLHEVYKYNVRQGCGSESETGCCRSRWTMGRKQI